MGLGVGVAMLWAAAAAPGAGGGASPPPAMVQPGEVQRLRTRAEAGDASAQNDLAVAYRRGIGVEKSEAEAQRWFARAAAQGHARAQASLALALFQTSRRADAFPLLEKASAQGERRAQYVLGTALFNGDGVAKDWPRAYALMLRATTGGLAAARTSLTEMEKYLPAADRARGAVLARTIAGGERKDANVSGRAATPPAKAAKVSPAPDRSKPDAPAKPVPAEGRWTVQLGAFGRMQAAQAHWASLSRLPALTSLTPRYVAQGAMVRLRAGPLPDKAAATRACRAATAGGSACFPVAP